MTLDGQARNYFPAMRIFVFGTEVTEDVLSCTVNYNDGRAPNTAEFTLANAGTIDPRIGGSGSGAELVEIDGSRSSVGLDRYIVTEKDIQALYPDEVNAEEITLPDSKEVIANLEQQLQANAEVVKKAEQRQRRLEAQALEQEERRRIIENTGTADLLNDASLDEAVARLGAQAAQDEVDIAKANADKLSAALAEHTDPYQTILAERRDSIILAIRRTVNNTVQDPIKRDILSTKSSVVFTGIQQPSFDETGTQTLSLKDILGLKGEAFRYPFQVGDCIFHSNDPVRIFWRDPQNPAVWYHMFAGFVTDWSEIVTENNEKTVTIRCEDVSRILRYARIAFNPGVFDQRDVQTVNDEVVRTFHSDGFPQFSFSEFLFSIVFGSDKLAAPEGAQNRVDIRPPKTFSYERVGPQGETTTVDLSTDGTGAFNFDRSMIALLPISGKTVPDTALESKTVILGSLAEYQAVVDHQVRESDLENMVVSGGTATKLTPGFDGRAPIEEVITELGTKPHLYPVDGGRLIMLAPESLGDSLDRNVILKDIATTINTQTEWHTRLGLIYDYCERIQFSFYASPRGDLLCEMPLFNFDTDDFGTTDPVDITLLETDLTVGGAEVTYNTNEVRGPYQKHYVVPRRDTISWERSFSDEQVRTMMLCSPAAIQLYQSVGDTAQFGENEVVLLQSLVPQFGVRAERVDAMGLIASPEAAHLYAELRLSQMNADARSAHVEVLPRISVAFPNRPIEFQERSFMATLRQIQHTLVWNEDMRSSYDVNYVRGWAGQRRGDIERPTAAYEPIGGFAAGPLDYARLLVPRRQVTSSKKREGSDES